MKITEHLIERFFRNECTREEMQHIDAYFSRHPEKLERWLPYEEWLAQSGEEISNDKQETLRLLTKRSLRQHENSVSQNKRLLYRWASAAAITLFVMGLALWIKMESIGRLFIDKEDKLIAQADTSIASNLYYINSSNEIMNVESGDGSIISLYPRSEIRFAESFEFTSSRDFYLVGKAQFDVAKDTTKAFRVYSKGLEVTALGTVFVVDEIFQSYVTKVRLIEGQIEVTSKRTATKNEYSTILSPTEEIMLDYRKSTIVSKVNADLVLQDRGGFFKEDKGKIIFENMDVKDVLLILQKNYNVFLEYNESQMVQKYYTGTFNHHEEVYKNIINEINYLHNVHIKWGASE